jgi:hypothetical protein
MTLREVRDRVKAISEIVWRNDDLMMQEDLFELQNELNQWQAELEALDILTNIK